VGDASASDALVISRWNLIPDQGIGDGIFHVGVVAFHSHGMDRVEFSLNNGPWISISERSVNPRTNVEEYFVTLDGSKYSENELQIKAVCYPKNGKTFVHNSIRLFKNDPGKIVQLPSGDHDLAVLEDTHKPPHDGWLVFKPEDGVSQDSCRIVGGTRFWGGRYKFEGLTIKIGGADDEFAYGAQGEGKNSWFWYDKCMVIGNGPVDRSRWMNHNWDKTFATDSKFTKLKVVFHGSSGQLLCRNCEIYDVYEDVFRAFGLVTGTSVKDLVRPEEHFHPDLLDFANTWIQNNVIFHNCNFDNVQAQGFAGGEIENTAFVDVKGNFPGWSSMQISGKVENLFMQNTDLIGGARFRNLKDEECKNIVFRKCKLGWQEPFEPALYKNPSYSNIHEHPAMIWTDEVVK